MREMKPEECRAYLEQAQNRPLLLDVREPWEYNIVHLEDSRLIPMHQVPMTLDTLDRNREVIVICHHGIRSRRVALFLEQSGFTNVVNLWGGLDAWARTVDPGLATY